MDRFLKLYKARFTQSKKARSFWFIFGFLIIPVVSVIAIVFQSNNMRWLLEFLAIGTFFVLLKNGFVRNMFVFMYGFGLATLILSLGYFIYILYSK